jgi:ABC-type transport system involved in multi-copper enzyme maturation permease subunit
MSALAAPTEPTRPVGGAGESRPILASTRAELLRLRKWPAVWVTIGAWLLMNAVFGYVFNYITYTSGDSNFSNEGQTRAELLQTMLPAALPTQLPQGMPLFGGALMMVLGAIVAGNGYGWGTWKTVFSQGRSRTATVLGSMSALTVFVVGLVLVTALTDVAMSLAVAGAESRAVVWPALGDSAESLGISLLVMETWALAGFLLGTLARGPALSVGLGLVWGLVVENLLRGVGSSLAAVDTLTHFLPGTAMGSLVGRFVGVGGPDTTPGLVDALSSERALVTTLVYLVGLPLLSLWLIRRRDVT